MLSYACVQVVSIIASFKLQWPDSVVAIMHGLSWANFNFDLAKPECSVPGFRWLDKYLLMMLLLPTGVALVGAMVYTWAAVGGWVEARARACGEALWRAPQGRAARTRVSAAADEAHGAEAPADQARQPTVATTTHQLPAQSLPHPGATSVLLSVTVSGALTGAAGRSCCMVAVCHGIACEHAAVEDWVPGCLVLRAQLFRVHAHWRHEPSLHFRRGHEHAVSAAYACLLSLVVPMRCLQPQLHTFVVRHLPFIMRVAPIRAACYGISPANRLACTGVILTRR